MLRVLAVSAALVLTVPAFAGNARSDRTAVTVQQYLVRQQASNAQWSQRFRQVRSFDQEHRTERQSAMRWNRNEQQRWNRGVIYGQALNIAIATPASQSYRRR